jgi:hypothetical protein
LLKFVVISFTMDSNDEEAVAAATAVMLNAEGRKRIWTNSWIANRLEFGAYHALVSELGTRIP